MFNTSSDNLSKVIKNAGKIAMELGGNQVGTEHILYGLTTVKDCMSNKILAEYGVTSASLKEVLLGDETAEKVLGTTDVSSIPQQQYVTNIFPQPVNQLQQADAAINNVQKQVPSVETVPVQVNNPQSLNSLVGSPAIQFENAPTDNAAHSVQQQVNSQAYTVPIEQTLNTNLSQQQFAPSEEITSNSEFETQTDNDVDQVTTLNEPPVLPAFDDNVSSNLKQSSGYEYELISIFKKYLKSSIERYELQVKTQSEILNELEKYEEKLMSEKHDNSQEMTTNYVTEPSFNTDFNNTYDEQGVSSGLHM